jgi:hypothetical protein
MNITKHVELILFILNGRWSIFVYRSFVHFKTVLKFHTNINTRPRLRADIKSSELKVMFEASSSVIRYKSSSELCSKKGVLLFFKNKRTHLIMSILRRFC